MESCNIFLFVSGLFHLVCFQVSSMLQHVSFLRLPLDYATFYFSVLLLVDTWVVFVFWVMLDLFCGCSCCEHCCAVCALSRFVLSDSLRLHGLQPARLVCPWWFSRQEYWSGLPCPPPGDLLNPGIEPRCVLHCRQIGFFTRRIPEPPGEL